MTVFFQVLFVEAFSLKIRVRLIVILRSVSNFSKFKIYQLLQMVETIPRIIVKHTLNCEGNTISNSLLYKNAF